jgi:hypothetical protein
MNLRLRYLKNNNGIGIKSKSTISLQYSIIKWFMEVPINQKQCRRTLKDLLMDIKSSNSFWK